MKHHEHLYPAEALGFCLFLGVPNIIQYLLPGILKDPRISQSPHGAAYIYYKYIIMTVMRTKITIYDNHNLNIIHIITYCIISIILYIHGVCGIVWVCDGLDRRMFFELFPPTIRLV